MRFIVIKEKENPVAYVIHATGHPPFYDFLGKKDDTLDRILKRNIRKKMLSLEEIIEGMRHYKKVGFNDDEYLLALRKNILPPYLVERSGKIQGKMGLRKLKLAIEDEYGVLQDE